MNSEATVTGQFSAQRQIEAASVVVDCHRVLARGGDNIVSEILRDQNFVEWEHYPADDAHDPLSHSQYYFHAHPPGDGGLSDYGHFHLFMREEGIPESFRKPKTDELSEPNLPVHLIGISVTREGLPEGLFTTNAWVTGEPWYPAEILSRLLDDFVIDVARPSWLVNRWVSAMIVLFRPQIDELLLERDRVVAAWRIERPEGDPLADRGLEYPSHATINLFEQIARIESLGDNE